VTLIKDRARTFSARHHSSDRAIYSCRGGFNLLERPVRQCAVMCYNNIIRVSRAHTPLSASLGHQLNGIALAVVSSSNRAHTISISINYHPRLPDAPIMQLPDGDNCRLLHSMQHITAIWPVQITSKCQT
jgi:hypothetical protein